MTTREEIIVDVKLPKGWRMAIFPDLSQSMSMIISDTRLINRTSSDNVVYCGRYSQRKDIRSAQFEKVYHLKEGVERTPQEITK